MSHGCKAVPCSAPWPLSSLRIAEFQFCKVPFAILWCTKGTWQCCGGLWTCDFCHVEKARTCHWTGSCVHLLNSSSLRVQGFIALEEASFLGCLYPQMINIYIYMLERKACILVSYKYSWNKLLLENTCSLMVLFSPYCMWQVLGVSGEYLSSVSGRENGHFVGQFSSVLKLFKHDLVLPVIFLFFHITCHLPVH